MSSEHRKQTGVSEIDPRSSPGSQPARTAHGLKLCESTLDGPCTRPATWRQLVHTGQRAGEPFLLHAYWCDAHAEAIVRRRRQEGLEAGQIVQIGAQTANATR